MYKCEDTKQKERNGIKQSLGVIRVENAYHMIGVCVCGHERTRVLAFGQKSFFDAFAFLVGKPPSAVATMIRMAAAAAATAAAAAATIRLLLFVSASVLRASPTTYTTLAPCTPRR